MKEILCNALNGNNLKGSTMTQYEKDRELDVGGTEEQKRDWKTIATLLTPNEYDGVIKIKGFFVAHLISENGEVEAYDLYDKDRNFILSYTDFSVLLDAISDKRK